MSVSCCMV